MLFISYASQDKAVIETLVTTLRRSGQHVWLDEELGGGETWWRAILEQIRRADLFVVAVSEHSLASKPCQAELRYAQALQRPVLPVQIGAVDSLRLTPLATTQIFDFRHPTARSREQLLAAASTLIGRDAPLPTPLPAEPPVPFAYLMRLATTMSSPELSRYQQAELVTELKNRLDEDRNDPAACRDITRLLYLLHERPDVTWRTRTDIDAILGLAAGPASGPLPTPTQPFTGPQAVSTLAFTAPQPLAEPPTHPAAETTAAPPGWWRRHRRWLLAGAAAVVSVVTATVVVVITRPAPVSAGPMLISDADLEPIMGTEQLAIADSGVAQAKQSSLVDITPTECGGALYPGLDSDYLDSGAQQVSWRVSEPPGGLKRAGVNNNPFVDQAVAVFAPKSAAGAEFVRRSAQQWRDCAGKTVTVDYRDGAVFTWLLGEPRGESPRIVHSFTLVANPDYGCQRVLNAVADAVIDVKTCGIGLTDQANRVSARLIGTLTDIPSF